MKIVFYDGVCPLCDHLVKFLISRDKHGVLRYASLQGVTAKKNLHAELTKSLETIVFQDGNQVYTHTDAVVRILIELNFYSFIIFILKKIPTKVLDFFYMIVSRKRYQLWGKYDECQLPPVGIRDRFLE